MIRNMNFSEDELQGLLFKCEQVGLLSVFDRKEHFLFVMCTVFHAEGLTTAFFRQSQE